MPAPRPRHCPVTPGTNLVYMASNQGNSPYTSVRRVNLLWARFPHFGQRPKLQNRGAGGAPPHAAGNGGNPAFAHPGTAFLPTLGSLLRGDLYSEHWCTGNSPDLMPYIRDLCLGSQDSDAGVARAWRGRGAGY
eukprot:gene9041-biopygen12180